MYQRLFVNPKFLQYVSSQSIRKNLKQTLHLQYE